MSAAVESMAYAGQVPWHGLGIKVDDAVSPEEMLKEAGLDWTVEKVPMYYSGDRHGEDIPIEGHQLLIRSSDGKQLGVVSKDWIPLQNSEALDFFRHFTDAGNMKMETAGSLHEGRIVWALARVTGRVFEAVRGDAVESYLLLSNPHQYGKCITVQSTSIRVVCQNTLNLALEGPAERVVRVNHKTKFNPDVVQDALGVVGREFHEYERKAKYLVSRRYTDMKHVHRYFDELAPRRSSKGPAEARKSKELSDLAAKMVVALDAQPGHQYAEGTYWQMFNAVTYVLDHQYGRSSDDMAADRRMKSAWYGLNRTRKRKALDLALRYAEMEGKRAA